MARAFTANRLMRQNHRYRGTGGVSANNRQAGFRPAFLDHNTGAVYISCSADGTPSPFHRLDGLPPETIETRDSNGRVVAVKSSIEAGFERGGKFYSRDEAARAVAHEPSSF